MKENVINHPKSFITKWTEESSDISNKRKTIKIILHKDTFIKNKLIDSSNIRM